MARAARGENNRNDVLVHGEVQEGLRIEQRDRERQQLRDSLRMQLVYAWDTWFQLASRGHSHYNARGAVRLPRSVR